MNFFGFNTAPFAGVNNYLQDNLFDRVQTGLGSINEAMAGPAIFQQYSSPIGPGLLGPQGMAQPSATQVGYKDTLGIDALLGGGIQAPSNGPDTMAGLLGAIQQQAAQPQPMTPPSPLSMPRPAPQPAVSGEPRSLANMQRPSFKRGLLG